LEKPVPCEEVTDLKQAHSDCKGVLELVMAAKTVIVAGLLVLFENVKLSCGSPDEEY
jgi:hypothetical protein